MSHMAQPISTRSRFAAASSHQSNNEVDTLTALDIAMDATTPLSPTEVTPSLGRVEANHIQVQK